MEPLLDTKSCTLNIHSISENIILNMTCKVVSDVLLRKNPANIGNLVESTNAVNVFTVFHQTWSM